MIERLVADSRRCAPGTAFFAWPGERDDGRRHIAEAIARGAAAVLWEAEGFAWNESWRVPNVAVPALRAKAGFYAHEFWDRPSEALWVCGVTGTNGKTTTTQWLAWLLSDAGVRAGVIGTLGAGFPAALEALERTTPDALALHESLARLRHAGARAVAMEVSSHALVQHRVTAVAFDCALFTNLSRDHLDYHGTMQAYGEAKARLFETPGLERAVFNLDDAFGAELARRAARRGLRTIGTALSRASLARAPVAEYVLASDGEPFVEGGRVRLFTSWGEADAVLPHPGRHNAENALGVLACALAAGIDLAAAAGRLARLPAVAGRLERLGGAPGEPLVYVDYAHGPDALDRVLAALSPVARARGGALVAVFGAGGERDRGKRPEMGAVAERHAARIVLTSDNPRGEDPASILADIRRGIVGPCTVIVERGEAIEHALATAAPEDVVLVAGRGHEAFQEIGGRRQPFSDAQAVRAALARRSRR